MPSDQAEELAEDDWVMLRGRIRLRARDARLQIYGACNPSAPTHFLARRFGLNGEDEARDGCEAITTKWSDNWFLPQSYLDDLATFTGLAKARFVDGLWVGSEGLVYDTFDPALFVKHRPGPWKRVVVGVDWGYTHPTAMLVICQDEQGHLHVADEFCRTRQLETDVTEHAKRFG